MGISTRSTALPANSARQLALDMIQRYQVTSWPVPVYRIAEKEGATIQYRHALSHGSLAITSAGYEMTIDVTLNEFRRRFSVAHELAHLLLHRQRCLTPNLHQGVLPGFELHDDIEVFNEEEYCNEFARHLLIPYEAVSALLDWGAVSIPKITWIARKELRVSPTALAWQIVAYATGTGGILIFRRMGKPADWSDVKLRLDWGIFPKAQRTYLPRYDAVPKDSRIHEGVGCRTQVFLNQVSLHFGGLRGKHSLLVGEIGKSSTVKLLAIVLPRDVHCLSDTRLAGYMPQLPFDSEVITY